MSTAPEPDCGSSSCIFSARGGMRTNGPCRCYENAGFHGSAVMAAKQMLREVLLLRARLDAMPHDRTWTKDKPTTGKWWVSFVPTRRVHNQYSELFPALVRCNVRNEAGQTQVQFPPISLWHSADLPIFEGALWMRNEDPADPFAETQPSYSQDSDLP